VSLPPSTPSSLSLVPPSPMLYLPATRDAGAPFPSPVVQMLSELARSTLVFSVLHGRDLNLEPAPCSIEVQATKESARAFFQKFQEEDSDQFLYMRLLEEAHFKKSFSINVDCTHIFQFDRALYNKLTSYPTVR